ncbi:MAG TPA: hypothetical protein VF614_00350 [Chthoniobacteraceae bacterium]|jgi:hypothetical protein
MNPESVQTSLRFAGDWPWWFGLGAALLLAGVVWFFYWREVRSLRRWVRWLLPTLRALAVIMLVLMLSGPVLHHRKVVGQLSRLLLFVDGSKSMDLTDPGMDTGRKILILQRAGLLPKDAVKLDLPRAAQALSDAEALAEKAKTAPAPELAGELAGKVRAARELIAADGSEGDRLERFDRELFTPVNEITGRKLDQIDDKSKAAQDLAKLSEPAQRWQSELAEAFEKRVGDLAQSANSPLAAALQRFDSLPRWQRVQSILLEGESQKMLANFAERYDLQVVMLKGSEAEKVWQPTARDSALPAALPKPEALNTNLGFGLKASADGQDSEERGAVVIFSDGQHNEGDSPVEAAKVFGARGVPIYTVGLGGQKPPRDLAILAVEGPQSVFFQDRVRGQITLKDNMPAGQAFTVFIKDGDKVVWEQQLTTENKQLRKVAFDFPVAELVVTKKAAARQDAAVQTTGLPMDLQVQLSAIEGDRELSNNEDALRFRAVTQKRKILIIDGRARWETRYLRNLFERDEQWEVVSMLAEEKLNGFPEDPGTLATFDLIIFGEVKKEVFKGEELQWINDFVAQRGGAVIFIDGARGRLKEYAETPLAALFPVEWKAADVRSGITKVALTERSQTLSPFALAADKPQNLETWSNLRPPHWLSGATALAGAETLLEAEVGGERVAAMVYRPFGAGRVLYHAFDDSWRWRFEVADQVHVKFWQQAANWIAELPFAVRDKFVSLDAGAITYAPGESAELRVRLRDGEGKPVTNAAVNAVLYRDGKKAATLQLSPEENAGGLFRGRTAALESGDYEVAVESLAVPENELKARTEFKVTPRQTGELTLLHLNEDLLRQVSAASGGVYLREENVDQLPGLLAPMSRGKVIESDTVLWQSYWWFIPLILLLAIEWIIRKRVGLL